MPKLLTGLAVVQTVWLIASGKLLPVSQKVFTAEEWRMHIIMHGLLVIGLILFSYRWFGTFFNSERNRWR